MKHKALFISFLFCLLTACFASAGEPQEKTENPEKKPVAQKYSFTISFRMENVSFSHLPWVWNVETKRYVPSMKQRETSVAIFIRNPLNPSFFDVWVWRACRCGSSGYADDLHAYLMPDGSLSLKCDAGLPPWQVTRPPATFQSSVMSRYVFREPTESRGNVLVFAKQDQETASVQLTFVRDRKTGYPDDLPLSNKLEYARCVLIGDTPVMLSDLQFFPLKIKKVSAEPVKSVEKAAEKETEVKK